MLCLPALLQCNASSLLLYFMSAAQRCVSCRLGKKHSITGMQSQMTQVCNDMWSHAVPHIQGAVPQSKRIVTMPLNSASKCCQKLPASSTVTVYSQQSGVFTWCLPILQQKVLRYPVVNTSLCHSSSIITVASIIGDQDIVAFRFACSAVVDLQSLYPMFSVHPT